MCHDKDITNALIQQFLCCTPINILSQTICKPNVQYTFNIDAQKEILNRTVDHYLVKQYPLKQSYQKAFLKWLMTKIEEGNQEIHDDVYTAYCNLVSESTNEAVHFRHFLTDNGRLNCVTLQESTNIISEGTTGLCSWQGAVTLSKWCNENRDEFHRKSVLELGCGVGLTGLNVISSCTPKEYIFSDCHHAVLRMVCTNVKLNLLQRKEEGTNLSCSGIDRLKLHFTHGETVVKVLELPWEEIGNYILEGWTVPEIIIGADILYESSAIDALVAGLKKLLSFDGRYAIIAATVRNADTISYFLEQLGDNNLSFEECVLPQETSRIQLANCPIRVLKIFQRR